MNVSCGCYDGTDAEFDNLRLIWAQAAGYGITDHRAVGGPLMPNLDYDQFSPEDMLGHWPGGAPEDPLLILLVHEEHKGCIKATHCPFLADRLDQLVMVLMKDPDHRPAWVLLTQQFVNGLRYASHHKTDVIFS